ncbi:heat shock transcription factor 2 [Aaosphaeria arxii CBS 175.79]|uniref:Mannose-1-phosphate guanyltransferase n=1 Tax=Aaosphaeria arxii CBS 175.79 TaxID=1450172 RepID=A0A6A5XHC2_9PLEO|nr:heat shock transcription factor 2 [Aaosphaeria arxii CBS 175.79]KAF2012279.1 heat shock transcription factor 2 [Aaosphaeria arxii CBS 175.79]
MDSSQGGGSGSSNSSDFSVVRWGNDGDSFVVLENEKFTKHILPKHFKHSNFASFVRQLNKYDFHKVRHNNEENGQSPYGAGAWEFKHPDFKANNKDALDNIRRKAPAPRKANAQPEDMIIPSQQLDLMNTQLMATQAQLQSLQDRYNELSIHHSMLLQEVIGLQKTVVNHEHVMQNVMTFLHNVDAQRRRDSRLGLPFNQPPAQTQNGNVEPPSNAQGPTEDDIPASPLQHASKLLSETNADVMLNPRNLEHMNEITMRMNGTLTTPPPEFMRNLTRPVSRGPASAGSSASARMNDLDNVVYPVGHTNGIDPMYSEHINNIPYPMPSKPAESTEIRVPEPRKKSSQIDPGWVRPPQILLVEDDPTCRRIGSKFLYAFHCSIDSALDGLEAVNKMNAGSKYDLVLMDIIMPNLDGVSACHLIRQFDNTPIIAMTSNIRSDDISMYFQHGMNDVLPKPFTKEGLLQCLDKHLVHLKKSHVEGGMVAPQPLSSARQVLKEEESPAKSPATTSNWNSPNAMPGVSPVGSNVTDEYLQAVQNHSGQYGVNPMQGAMGYSTSPQMQLQARQQQQQGHRRQLSDISGGDDMNNPAKRQQIYCILADPFETRFSPFTLERPRCLLPLANTPLIEYTFEFLANGGVEEVFVYCGAHKEQVEDYITRSKWNSRSSPFSRLELIQSTSHSIGDAMRDLDTRGLLVGDFLVVYGDVVSNLSLEPALAAHRARRAKDKNAIMTMVLREAGTSHRTKAQGTNPIFVIDPSKERCLHFEQMPNREQTHTLSIDPDLLSDNQELEIRGDLIDCGIDICTPDVLALWSDNFDFQAPRKGFLHSVLKDYELNGKTIHTHIVAERYAARVRNLHAYDSVSRDIVSRWAYPLCPDSNLLQGQSYRLQKGNTYKEEGVILARDCIINPKTVIGRGSSIGDGSVISNSIIGVNCNIGRGVTIDGAYIWDHAIIGDGSTVTQAIVANEAQVGKNCTIEPGALVSYSVRISDGVTVRSESRVTRAKRRLEQGEELAKGEPDIAIVGDKGDGFEFQDSEEEDEDEVVDSLILSGKMYNLAHLSLSADSISTLYSDSEADFDVSHNQNRSAADSFVSVGSQDSYASQHAANFDHDASSSIYDSLNEGHDSANIQLELTALRMSTNASDHQVRRSIVVAFVKRITSVVKAGTSVKNAVAQVFEKHRELVERSIFDKKASAKTDQVDFMMLLQNELSHREGGDMILLSSATKLIEIDLIEEEGMLQWWADPKSSEKQELLDVRQKTGQLIDYLNQSSEEESDDEDDDED